MRDRDRKPGFVEHAIRSFPTLYKYLPTRYANALVERGELRLGTLHDFQDEERHGASIGDRSEGVKVVYDNPPLLVTGTGAPLSPPVRRVLGEQPGAGLVFDHCLFSVTQRSLNRWLYCTSKILDAVLLDDFKADCCVRINEPRAFYRAIFQELVDRQLCVEMFVIECIYGERTQHYLAEDRIPPEALKDPSFSRQAEYRGIFVPSKLPIEPLVLRVSSCAQYCTILDEPRRR